MLTRQPCEIAVVIATRNRVRSLCVAIEKLLGLPENPEIIVVDNGSNDGTVGVVSERFPAVKVIALQENRGAAARNIGVGAARAKIVAFSDDDSWWHPGSLTRAANYFDQYPRLGLVAAKVFVNGEFSIDPTCKEMAQSPLLGAPELPGRPVLGFIACGVVVRSRAFLQAGGFHARFGVGGEESLLAIDMASQGWELRYLDDLIAYHYPQLTQTPEPSSDNRLNRRQVMVRNALWSTWLRRPWSSALQQLLQMTPSCFTDAPTRKGLVAALHGMPWVLAERRLIPDSIENDLRTLEEDA